jgi:hypothetical protein
MIKFLNFDIIKLKNNSKSRNLFALDQEGNEHFDLDSRVDTSSFIEKSVVFNLNVAETECDKYLLLKILCEKLMQLILLNRNAEKRLDSVSYCLLLIIFNM